MGFASTDPVEPPFGGGDVTMAGECEGDEKGGDGGFHVGTCDDGVEKDLQSGLGGRVGRCGQCAICWSPLNLG